MGKHGPDNLKPTSSSQILIMTRIKSHTESLPPITFTTAGGIEGGSVKLLIFLKTLAQYFFLGECFWIKDNLILHIKPWQYGHEVSTGLPVNVILSM